MQGLALDKWYKGLVAAGVALMGIGALAKEKPVIAIALGMVLFGVGAWVNSSFLQGMQPGPYGSVLKTTREIRHATVLGVVLEIIGAAFFGVGAWKLMFGLL